MESAACLADTRDKSRSTSRACYVGPVDGAASSNPPPSRAPPPGRDAIHVLAGLPLTSRLRLVPSSSTATPGVRADRDVIATRHALYVARNGLRSPPPGRGRFASSVMCIGMAAPALDRVARGTGATVPERYVLARSLGLLGRGAAESPSPRDHRDLLFRGDPAKRLSARTAIPVLTVGDDS